MEPESRPVIREATEQDVPGIRDVFTAVYGREYPYQGFYDEYWLKRSVFTDDILMLVAVEDGKVMGTASVVFDIGAHSDLIGECGRLAVHPEARGRGIGNQLMHERFKRIANRLHVAIVENRTVHPFSQQISHAHGFCPVGFLPLKHLFTERESLALYVRHFGNALSMRANHPRVVPEAYPLAHVAMDSCGLTFDAIVDEDSAPYPHGGDFACEELTAEGMPALIRIERGRVHGREIFGPMRLQYGFFKLTARHATYLLARQRGPDGGRGPIAGAIGFIQEDFERTVRVFELIARTDRAIRFLFEQLLERCRGWKTDYVETDVSAHAPRMQRTLVELGFLPVAFVPAMVFHDVERVDVVKMARLFVPFDMSGTRLTPGARIVADQVARLFERQHVLPHVARAVHRMSMFSGLSEEQATRVASACSVRELKDGEFLFRAGEPPQNMFIILKGTIAVQLGDPPRALGTVPAGEPVGELSLLTAEPHSASAVARGETRLAVLSRSEIGALTRQRPDIGVIVYRNLAVSLGRKLQQVDATLLGRDQGETQHRVEGAKKAKGHGEGGGAFDDGGHDDADQARH